MKPLGEPRRHFWLVQKMAQKQGVDLTGAMARGDLDQADWAGMVTRCRGCTGAEACAQMPEQGGSGELPEYCRNRERFRILLADQIMAENI